MQFEEIREYTLRMNRILGSFEALFQRTCNQYLAKKLIGQVQSADAAERPFARRELEKTLVANGIEAEVRYDVSGKVLNAEEIISLFPSQDELERQLYERLSEMYTQFPGTNAFIERLVERLGDPDLREGSVRLRILRQFLRYIRKSVYSVKKLRLLIEGEFTEEEAGLFAALKKEEEKRSFYALHVKEEIFEALRQPAAFGLKSDDIRLLAVCDNFAKGRILNQGGTRKAVYEFGIVFGMSVGSSSDPEYDPMRDIERNLFFDFHINGYVDILRAKNDKAGADTANEELTTEGINYKNYAEIIYIYTLKHPGLPREDKIKYAQDLIRKCSAHMQAIQQGEEEEGTQLFRGFTWHELLTEAGYQLPEQELISYICAHYPVKELNRSVSPFMLSAEQNSSLREYVLFYEQMEDELQLYDRSFDELDYSLGIFEGDGREADPEEYPFPPDLRMVLLNLNNELRCHTKRRKELLREYRELRSGNEKTRKENGKTRKENMHVRRLDFLILYYEYFIAVHEDDGENQILMLEDVYRAFADHLGPIFVRSRYAELSAKSMPDVLLVLFAYNMVSLLS